MSKISQGMCVSFLNLCTQNLKRIAHKVTLLSSVIIKKAFPSKSYASPPVPWVGTHLKHTPELDGIRGYACLSVLILHCLTGILFTSNPWLSGFRQYINGLLLSGVDLFFVLSGFLIGGILLDTKNKPHYFKIFWIKRVTRIFPVAYLMLATYAAAIFITDHFHITRFNNWLLAEYRPPLWTFATFTQSIPIAIHGYGGPRWMAMSWSLAIEDQFYLIFPLAVYFMPKKRLIALVIACLFLAPILRDVFLRIFGDWYAGYVLLPSRMDGIMYGVVLAIIIRSKNAFDFVTRYRVLLDFMALFFLYLLVMSWAPSWWPGMSTDIFPLKQSMISIMWGIAILRVYTYTNSIFNKIWCNRLLIKTGMISYALYMFHQTINGLVHGIIFNHQEPYISTLTELLAGLAVILISIGLATVSYIFFERPIQRYGRAVVDRVNQGKVYPSNTVVT